MSNLVNSKTGEVSYSLWSEFLMLTKHRLTLFVVFSSVMAYLASLQGPINIIHCLLLLLGGYCISGASNTINQILEKDYDKLMKRTANRPLASGRIQVGYAILLAGFLWLAGILMLGAINIEAMVLGCIAVVLYAFLYTPLKRYSTFAVFVGAIPGALPLLVGNVAAVGEINSMGIFLFAIQFVWQFPHFWAIGWMSFDDYQRAGYKLVAMRDGEIDSMTGIYSAVYALLTIPITVYGYMSGIVNVPVMAILIIASVIFAFYGYRLYTEGSKSSAKELLYASLVHLFVCLGSIYIFNWIG